MRCAAGLFVLSLLASACSGGVHTESPGDADAVDAATTEASLAEGRTGDAADVPRFDGLDGMEPDGGGVCTEPGGFACPCKSGSDCTSGLCVQHMGDLVCSAPCVEECPVSGWSCKEYSGFGDTVFICLSDFANLCWPCGTDADCKAGGTGDVCVDYGTEGSFCGGACSGKGSCPGGYECVEATGVSGLQSMQCVAVAGTCACTALAAEKQAWTACVAENSVGSCAGKRVCGDGGLAECDAQTPVEETCNGIDDDCDGQVDGDDLCDDGSPCTQDVCSGSGGCQHVPAQDGAECIDGDFCTQKDHCEGGKCVGVLVDCGDGNDCTSDSCEPETGDCLHAVVDDGTPCQGDVPGTVLACAAGKCECVPQCAGKVCGDDGCKGSCGACGYPEVLCWQDGQACIGQPCVDSSECEPGLYCDKTKDPAQCLPGCDSDEQCAVVCPAAGSQMCLPSNQCICALGGWPGTAQLPEGSGCLMSGDGICVSADRFESVAGPEDAMISASGKYRIESILWQ